MAGIDLRGPSTVNAASTASAFSPLSRISATAPHTAIKVEQSIPSIGTELTLATFTGIGTLRQVQVTVGDAGTCNKDLRLRIYTDGNALPDVDCDLGTLFLTALDASSTAQSAGTEHIQVSIADGGPRMSGGFWYPVPYSNGCVVTLYNPSVAVVAHTIYAQIVNHPGEASNYRLRSVCQPAQSPIAATATQQVTFFDVKNAKGTLVWFSLACAGTAASYGYLERQQWFALDGEATTPNGNGVIYPTFASSGGEDLFLNGWYFANSLQRIENPWVIVTAANNASKTAVAGVDMLGLWGGIPFANELKAGWALKDGPTGTSLLAAFTYSFCALYYVDTTQPFVPDAPTIGPATAGNALATVTWTPPTSAGSSGITGYTVTASPGGATMTAAAAATSLAFTGLTNGTAYTFTVKANNSVGSSAASAASNSVTPVNAAPPGAPTGLGVSAGDMQNVLTWTAPASSGGSSITNYKIYRTAANGATNTETLLTTVGNVLTYTDTGLANLSAYRYKVSAVNAVGEGSQSSEAAGTPTGGTLVNDSFAYVNGPLTGNVTPQGQTWATMQGSSNTVAGGVVKAGSTSGSDWFNSVNIGRSDATITTTVIPSHTTSNMGCGLRGNGSTKMHAAYEAASGSVKLWVAGVNRATTAVSSGAVGSSHTLTLDARGSAITVKWDGVSIITYTLTAGEVTALSGLTTAFLGFFTGGDDGTSQFTNITVTG